MNSQRVGDRAGIHCRTVADAAQVLDAVKGFESKDMFTAIPQSLIPKEPFASFVVNDKAVNDKPLKGIRIGIVREFMVKHTKNDVAISDQIDKERRQEAALLSRGGNREGGEARRTLCRIRRLLRPLP